MKEAGTITLVGNVVADPRHNVLSSGVAVSSFRLASNSRYLDKKTGNWTDGTPLFLTVNCWRTLGEHVAASLRRGDRVVVFGRLRQRQYTKDGVDHTVIELSADTVGPDLNRAPVTVHRLERTADRSTDEPWSVGAPADPFEIRDSTEEPDESAEPDLETPAA